VPRPRSRPVERPRPIAASNAAREMPLPDDGFRRLAGDVLAREEQLSAAARNQADGGVQRARLAGAVRAEEHDGNGSARQVVAVEASGVARLSVPTPWI